MNRSMLAAALLAVAAGPALAATNPATDTFDVKIKVRAACTVSATDLDFNTHDFDATANIDQTSTITVKCTKGTAYTVALNAGTTAGNTETARKMAAQNTAPVTGNSDTVAYALFNDTGRTVNWGSTAATGAKTGTGNGNNQDLTVYGRVLPSALNVTPDDYKDTITVSVSY